MKQLLRTLAALAALAVLTVAINWVNQARAQTIQFEGTAEADSLTRSVWVAGDDTLVTYSTPRGEKTWLVLRPATVELFDADVLTVPKTVTREVYLALKKDPYSLPAVVSQVASFDARLQE